MVDELVMVQGANHSAYTITWEEPDGTAWPLTGATITGKILNLDTGTSQALTGAFVLVTPASGIFSYTPSAADVATAGRFAIQFTATFSDTTKDRSVEAPLAIKRAL